MTNRRFTVPLDDNDLLTCDENPIETSDSVLKIKTELRKLSAASDIDKVMTTGYGTLVSLEVVDQVVESAELQVEAVDKLSLVLRKYHDETLVVFFTSRGGMPNGEMRSTLLKIIYFLCRCVQRAEKLLKGQLKELRAEKGRRNAKKKLASEWFSGASAKQLKWLKILHYVLRSEPLRDVQSPRIIEATLKEDEQQLKAILEVIVKTLVGSLRPLEVITEHIYRTTVSQIFQIIRVLCVDYHQTSLIANELMDLSKVHDYFHQTKTISGFPFVDAIAQVDKDSNDLRPLLSLMMERALEDLSEKSSRLFMSRLTEKRVDVIYAQLTHVLPLLQTQIPPHDGLNICFHVIKNSLHKCETFEQFYEREALLLIVWHRIHEENVMVRAKALNIFRQLYETRSVPIHWLLSPLLSNAVECLSDESKMLRQAAAGLIFSMAETMPFGENMNVEYLVKTLNDMNKTVERSLLSNADVCLHTFDKLKPVLREVLEKLVENSKTKKHTPMVTAKSSDRNTPVEEILKTDDGNEELIEELEEKIGQMDPTTSADDSRPTATDLIGGYLDDLDPKLSSQLITELEGFGWYVPKSFKVAAYQSGFLDLRVPKSIQDLVYAEDVDNACFEFIEMAVEMGRVEIKPNLDIEQTVESLLIFVKNTIQAYVSERESIKCQTVETNREKRFAHRHQAELLYRRLIFAIYHALEWERSLPSLSAAITQGSTDELEHLLGALKRLYLSKVRRTDWYLQKATELAWILDSKVQETLADVFSDIFYVHDDNPEVSAEQTIGNFLAFIRTISVSFRHSVSEAFSVTFEKYPLKQNCVFSLVMKCNAAESDQEVSALAAFLLESVVRADPKTLTTHLANLDLAHSQANLKAKSSLLRVFSVFNTQELAEFPAEDHRVFYSTQSPLVGNVLKTLIDEFSLTTGREWDLYAVQAVRFMFAGCTNSFNVCTRLMDSLFRRTRIYMQRVHSCRQMTVSCKNLLTAYENNDPEIDIELARVQQLFEDQFNETNDYEVNPTQNPKAPAFEVEDLDSSSDEYQKLIRKPLARSKMPPVRDTTKQSILSRLLYVSVIGEKENEVLEISLRRLLFVAGEIILRMLNFFEAVIPKEVVRRVQAFKYLNQASLFELQSLYQKRIIQSWPEYESSVLKKRKNGNLTTLEMESMCKVGIYELPEQSQEEEGGEVDVENETRHFVQQRFDEGFFVSKSLFGRLMPVVRSILFAEEYYAEDTVHAARCCLGKLMLTSEVVCLEYCDVFFTYLVDPNDQYREDLMVIAFDFFYRFHVTMKKYVPVVLQMLEDKSEKVRLTCFILMSFLIKQNLLLPNHRLPAMTMCLVDENANIRDHARAFFSQTETKVLYNQVLPSITFLYERKLDVVKFEKIMSFLFDQIFQRIERPADKCEGYRTRFCEILRALDSSDTRMAIFMSTALRVLFECRLEAWERLAHGLYHEFNSYKCFLRNKTFYRNFTRIVGKWHSNATNEQAFIENFKKRINSEHGTMINNELMNQTQPLSGQVSELLARELDDEAGDVEVEIPKRKRRASKRT